MKAEFINQPTSGQYEEKTFDLDTIWKSQIWSWVKFTTNNGIDWVGSFRGKPKSVAVAEKINQVAVLTSDGLFILDINKKEILFFDPQTDIKDLAETPTKDKFIIADFDSIGIVDVTFKTELLNIDYEIDNINFGRYYGQRLKINFEKLPNYKIINGFLNTENWKIEMK
ncbi:conserved hypothetical protein [Tenacibaculum sediminilitoris]|uniref:hypothetical protein n=1 Tax=Tenacibaculum sediminilitoris TaxID=1820334 RepID=UPI0038965C59